MEDVGLLCILYGVALLVLAAEVFLPSHGILTLTGMAFLIGAIVKTFAGYGQMAGTIAIGASLIVIPAFIFIAVRFWHATPMGKLISPPNPVLTDDDLGVDVDEMEAMVGREGKAVTPLHPVGICDINGRRVQCVAEFGVIEAGTVVNVTRINGSNLAVAAKT